MRSLSKRIGVIVLSVFMLMQSAITGVYASDVKTDGLHWFRSQLTEQGQDIYDALVTMFDSGAMKSGTDSYDLVGEKVVDEDVVVSYINGDRSLFNDFAAAKDAFDLEHPEAWYMDSSYLSFRVTEDESGHYHAYMGPGRSDQYYVYGVKGTDDVDRRSVELENVISEIVHEAEHISGSTDEETTAFRVKYVHGEVTKRISYRFETECLEENAGFLRTAYAIVTHEGVCEGYARSMQMVLNRLGIDNVLVHGIQSSGSPQAHMWNEVRIGDDWYAVDATWDDPVGLDKDGNIKQGNGFGLDGGETETYLLVGYDTVGRNWNPSGYVSTSVTAFTYPDIALTSYGTELYETNGLKVSYEESLMEGAKSTVYRVSFNGIGLTESANNGYYFLVKMYDLNADGSVDLFDDWYYPAHMLHTMTDVFDPDDDFRDNGSKYYTDTDEAMIMAVSNCEYVEFAVTTKAPPYWQTPDDLIDLGGYYNGDYTDILAETGLIFNINGDYEQQVYPKNASPIFNAPVKAGQEYRIHVEFTDDLYRPDEESISKSESLGKVNDAEKAMKEAVVLDYTGTTYSWGENGRKPHQFSQKPTPENIVWLCSEHGSHDDAGNITSMCRIWGLEYDFTASSMWADDSVQYEFTISGLVGLKSNKYVKTWSYVFENNYPFSTCPLVSGFDKNMWGQPQLLDNPDNLDLSSMTVQGVDGKEQSLADLQASMHLDQYDMNGRLMLVVESIGENREKTEQMLDALDKYQDINEEAVKASSLYEIDFARICRCNIVTTGQSVRVCVGFPEGIDGSMAGLTFKAYHFTKDANGSIISVEEIPCTVTPYGLVVTCRSFSPFEIIAFDSEDASSNDNTRTLVVAAGEGGTMYLGNGTEISASNGIIDMKPGDSITLFAQAADGKAVKSITFDGREMVLGSGNSVVIDYNDVVNGSSFVTADFMDEAVIKTDDASGMQQVTVNSSTDLSSDLPSLSMANGAPKITVVADKDDKVGEGSFYYCYVPSVTITDDGSLENVVVTADTFVGGNKAVPVTISKNGHSAKIDLSVIGAGKVTIKATDDDGMTSTVTFSYYEHSMSGDCRFGYYCSLCGFVVAARGQHDLALVATESGHYYDCQTPGCYYVGPEEAHYYNGYYSCEIGYTCSACRYEVTPDNRAVHKLGVTGGEEGHWFSCQNGCGYRDDFVSPHIPVVDFDCTTDDLCSVCGEVATKAETSHIFTEYTRGPLGHHQMCQRDRCYEMTDLVPHDDADDHDCTTEDVCQTCGYVIQTAQKSHVFENAPYVSGGEYGHYQVCQNKGCEGVSRTVRHRGGQANCSVLAVCEDCGDSYGVLDPNVHTGNTRLDNVKEATRESEGYTGDLVCSDCGTVLESGEIIEKLPEEHVHTFEMRSDSEYHWNQCSGCNVIYNRIRHRFGNEYHIDGNEHYQVCSVCTRESVREIHAGVDDDHDCTTALFCVCGYEVEGAKEHDFTHEIFARSREQHWFICENEGCTGTSIAVSHDSEDDGDCTTAVVCECGYIVRRADEHDFSGSLIGSADGHYHVCLNDGCEAIDMYDHVVVDDDKDCTTAVVCPDCGYELVSAKEHNFVGSAWINDGDGHHYQECMNEGCAGTSVKSDCFGGTATCIDQAVCSVCFVDYGDFDPENHEGGTEVKGYERPTEDHAGYTGDVYCLGCEKMISKGNDIPKLGSAHQHVFDKMVSDGLGHWYECECGVRDDESYETHSFNSDVLYNEYGHWNVCDVCGERGNISRHTAEENDFDCTTGLFCIGCAYQFVAPLQHHFDETRFVYDDNGHYHVCLNENCHVTSGHSDHSGEDDGDCSTAVICECGYVIMQANEHDWSNSYRFNEDGHYRICHHEGCEVRFGEGEHTGGEANCHEKAVCTVCGNTYGDLNLRNHTGGMALRDHKDATKEESGYTGDLYCLGCDAVLMEGREIPKIEDEHQHSFGNYEFDGEKHYRSCDGCGLMSYEGEHEFIYASDKEGHFEVCKVCGYAKDKVSHDMKMMQTEGSHYTVCTICEYRTNSEAHVFEKGVCGSCGYKDPDYKEESSGGNSGEESKDDSNDPEESSGGSGEESSESSRPNENESSGENSGESSKPSQEESSEKPGDEDSRDDSSRPGTEESSKSSTEESSSGPSDESSKPESSLPPVDESSKAPDDDSSAASKEESSNGYEESSDISKEESSDSIDSEQSTESSVDKGSGSDETSGTDVDSVNTGDVHSMMMYVVALVSCLLGFVSLAFVWYKRRENDR